MSFYEGLTYYDILDIAPDATPGEIREAYLRTKATYSRDSVALYTLVGPEEREEALKSLEEAYLVLSNPERRKEYDVNHGFINSAENPFVRATFPSRPNAVPMDQSQNDEDPFGHPTGDEDLLIPPKTDFAPPPLSQLPKIPENGPTSRNPVVRKNTAPYVRSSLPELDPALLHAIEIETEWKGSFLKSIRDAYRISIEEMSGITRVTKTYLTAIEEDNYTKLPAAVFIRGFVGQIAKVLKLPHEKVATAYLSRYYAARTHKLR